MTPLHVQYAIIMNAKGLTHVYAAIARVAEHVLTGGIFVLTACIYAIYVTKNVVICANVASVREIVVGNVRH